MLCTSSGDFQENLVEVKDVLPDATVLCHAI